METYAGIDLHSSNNYLGIIDRHDKRLYSRRLPNCIDKVAAALKPFQQNLTGIAVESTYNWYWPVDGLQRAGYKLHLANPSAIQQYQGLKHTDDKWDSFWLAHMLSVNNIKKLHPEDADQLFKDPYAAFAAKNNIETIRFLTTKIRAMENMILSKTKLQRPFLILTSTPGIGRILGLTIMLEIGDIDRFPAVGNYASYCRCVKSTRISNNKKKGQGNRKNGNRYLAWAYVEAAHLIIRYCPQANRFYQRKKTKVNGAVATKALANKLAKAHFYMLKNGVEFKKEKLFP